jgi:PKD repeat protein
MKHLLLTLVFIITFCQFSKSQTDITIYPKNNIVKIDSSRSFVWNKVIAALGYQLQIASDTAFLNLVVDSLTGDTNNLDISLSKGIYYWHLRSFNTGFSNWSPTKKITIIQLDSLATLAQHFISDSNVTLSAGTVDVWEDISGNNIQAIQSTNVFKPTQVSNVLNGHSAIRFDGVDDRLMINDSAQVGSLFILANWKGGSTFPSFNGLFNHQTTDIIFDGDLGSTSILLSFSPYFGSNVYINSILDVELAPLDRFKMIEGIKPTPSVLSNFVIAQDRNVNSRFWNGDYLEIIMFEEALNDSTRNLVEQYLRFKYAPPINLGPNISVTYGFCDTTLFAKKEWFKDYLWNSGSISDSLTVNKSGIYSVSTTDIFGFSSTDTIEVIFPGDFSKLTADTVSICLGDTLNVDTQLDTLGYNFLWSDGTIDSMINITTSGKYWVTVMDSLSCLFSSDTLFVKVDSLAGIVSLGPDKTVCIGSLISLTVGDTIGLSYLWNTADTTSQIAVDSAGTYTIEVTNNNNCIGYDTIVIDTSGIAPTAGFTIQNLCTNAVTLFTDTSSTTDGSNIIATDWDFGDGDTSIVQNPSHIYGSNSSFQVSLQITTDSGCVNTIIVPIQLYDPPSAGFFATTNPICSGQATNFLDNSFSTDGIINNWMWNFGDTGITDTSLLQNPSYNFPITNIYNVQLIATTQNNCSDTITNPITVKASPTASFTITNECVNTGTLFNNTSQGNISSSNWDFGDLNTSSTTNPTNTYLSSGNYTATLVVTEINGCIDTFSLPITIYDNPIAAYTPQDVCAQTSIQLFDSSTTTSGVIINWDWNVVGNSNQSSNQNPTFSFTTADTGLYFLDLIVTTDFGCKDSIRDSLNVYPLPIPNFIFNPTIGSPPLLVDFTNQTIGATLYNWDFGDNSSSTLISPSHLYTDSNTFIIKLLATNSFGCADSISQAIQVVNPIWDIAVTNVSYNLVSNANFLNISAQLANFGAFTINNLELEAEISGSGTILENWSGTLTSGVQSNYQFSSSFEINGIIPDLICVRALNPNSQIDAVPSNNEFCITLNIFQLINISPNPTSGKLNLEYIVPNSDIATVNLYNSIGEKVDELFSEKVEKGLVRQSFNLAIYSQGIYVIEILFQGKTIKQKIIKN